MLNDASGFQKIYIACGHTDLRRGIYGLAGIIREQFKLDPFQPYTLFLFCERRTDRIKGLLWEQDGFLLLYKCLAFTFDRPPTLYKSTLFVDNLMKNMEHVLFFIFFMRSHDWSKCQNHGRCIVYE